MNNIDFPDGWELHQLSPAAHDAEREKRATPRGKSVWRRSQIAKLNRQIRNLETWSRQHTAGAMLVHLLHLIETHRTLGVDVPIWLMVMARLYEVAERRHLAENINNWDDLPRSEFQCELRTTITE
jgi:hypothetical protein